MIRIVVTQRGWVFIGYFYAENNEIILKKSRVIRHWGTTKGLAQLVNGPTPQTILDDPCTQHIHPLAIITSIEVNESIWKPILNKK